MIIITDKAEMALEKALGKIRDDKTPQRCMYIKMPLLDPFLLDRLSQEISGMLNDPAAIAYVCEDGAWFILSQNLKTKIFDQIKNMIFPPSSQLPPQELAVLFDLQARMRDVMFILDQKTEKIAARAQKEETEKKAAEKETLRQKIMGLQIDDALIASIPKRRQEREKIGIMVIEDDAFTRQLISGVLAKEFDLTLAADGYDAIISYVSAAPDVVFLDIDLPDIGGLDVIDKILSMDKNTFIVMLSGHSQRSNIVDAVQRGAKGFIGKPFTKEKLFQYIEKSPRFASLKKE